MAFDHELRRYLEALDRGEPSARGPARRIDVDVLRQHLLTRLREWERKSTWVKSTHAKWTPLLDDFARYLELLPRTEGPTDRAGADDFARRVLDAAIDCLDDASLVDRLELERIARGFRGDADLAAYALEARLTASGPRLTPLAQAFLRLRGKDALRWLLTLEVIQNRGSHDERFIPRTLLADALRPTGIDPFIDGDGDLQFEYGSAVRAHAVDLGILAPRIDDGVVIGYRLNEATRDVVDAVVEEGPWHTAIKAMLADERSTVVPLSSSAASDLTIEHSRMITHEVRNALLPVQLHLDEIRGATQPPVSAHVEAAIRGVARVLDFVGQMVSVADVMSEPASPASVNSLIDEAVAATEGADQVEVRSSSEPTRVLAPRTRLVTALSNIVRNALQSGKPSPVVRVSQHRLGDAVRILVDDGGPGIPAPSRAKVFADGFTTKPGGSGFGLAFAKRVIEDEVHGKVWCETSDLGGARFVIELPTSNA